MNSRQKGKAGELELAKFLREHGFDEARRGVQYRGGGDSPDIVGLNGCHVEVKRTERLNLYDALDQARRDSAGTNRTPVVAHRCNDDRRKGSCRGEWIAILSFNDFLTLLQDATTQPIIAHDITSHHTTTHHDTSRHVTSLALGDRPCQSHD